MTLDQSPRFGFHFVRTRSYPPPAYNRLNGRTQRYAEESGEELDGGQYGDNRCALSQRPNFEVAAQKLHFLTQIGNVVLGRHAFL